MKLKKRMDTFNKTGLFTKKVSLCLFCFLAFSACGKEQASDKGNNMDTSIQTVYLKSKVSDQEMPISLPKCLIEGISVLPGKQQDKILASSMTMRVERLAFSHPEFPAHLECASEQSSLGADIYAPGPIGEQEEQLLKTQPFKYLLHTEISVGARYLDSKNNMDLYVVSPVSDGIFVNQDFPNISRPLYIRFIRFNPETPNSSFRYYFSISTVLKGEYIFTYTVIATAKNPSQFAEKLRNIIEEDKNVLDYPEVIAEFVANNEKIAAFFEKQQM